MEVRNTVYGGRGTGIGLAFSVAFRSVCGKYPPPVFPRPIFMSQHRSLRGAGTLGAKRNVLKRFERVEILKKRGQWKEGDRVTGLRKTRVEV